MTRRLGNAFAWCGTAALIVLAARAVAYALAPPTLLSLELRRSAGGPRLVVIAAVALTLAGAFSVAAVGLVALALRERLALDPRLEVPLPRPRPLRELRRFMLLWGISCLAFAYFESYLHWRAGLGWHGLHCLTGAVHRNAIPILAAFSLVAVALRLCGEHLVAWARRTLRRVLPQPHLRVRPVRLRPPPALLPIGRRITASRPRGPPRTVFDTS